MPAWLLPAIIAAVGAGLSGVKKTKAQNKQVDYERDQARADYDTKRVVYEEKDARRSDSIEMLKAVAKARGYNIPDSALAMLNARGPFKMPSADKAVLAPPKGNAWLDGLFGAVGAGMKTYGTLSGQEMAGGPAVPEYDGTISEFAPPEYPDDEIDVQDMFNRFTGGRR